MAADNNCPSKGKDDAENRINKRKAFDVLKNHIPHGQLPAAKAPLICLARTVPLVSGHQQASRVKDSVVAPTRPSTDKTACKFIADYDDGVSFSVIQRLLGVIYPKRCFFEMLAQYGSPAAVLEMLMNKHSVEADVIGDMYENE